MTCNNPNVDLVNMNAYIKFGENMLVSSQDIETGCLLNAGGQKDKFGSIHIIYLQMVYFIFSRSP